MLAKRLVERPRGEKKNLVSTLSEREVDVLKLMAEGRSNGGIAGQLFVTPKAVEKHIANIFGKLGLHADASEQHRRVLAVLTYLRSQRDDE
jgi:DNA-binding NarL/FixJ family response regulator